jgi:hypothetical protein
MVIHDESGRQKTLFAVPDSWECTITKSASRQVKGIAQV